MDGMVGTKLHEHYRPMEAEQKRWQMWTALVGGPLVIFTGLFYYWWYQVLNAIVIGSLFNAMKYNLPFKLTHSLVVVWEVISVPTFFLGYPSLPQRWRVLFVLTFGFAIAALVVHSIVNNYGPSMWASH